MTRFDEITDHYKARMRETHERHTDRLAEIERRRFVMEALVWAVGLLAVFAPFLSVLWGSK